jgi:hypothetical protein
MNENSSRAKSRLVAALTMKCQLVSALAGLKSASEPHAVHEVATYATSKIHPAFDRRATLRLAAKLTGEYGGSPAFRQGCLFILR